MNSGQTAIATIGGAVLADSLIGGIGIGMLGTAVGFPAAAIVATVGGTAAAAKFINENKPAIKAQIKAIAANRRTVYWLRRGDLTARFGIHPVSQKGDYATKRDGDDWFSDPTFTSVETLRKMYKDLLKQGFTPVV